MDFSPLQDTPLCVQARLEYQKRYLEQNPGEAIEKALTIYEDFCLLRIEHQKLKAQLAQPKQKHPQLPSLP